MTASRFSRIALAAAVCGAFLISTPVTTFAAGAAPASNASPVISLATMGSFFFGGSVEQKAGGETFHGDHGYAQYYVAAHSRTLPLVMWHGIGQSGKTYESTPDGREGYQALLPRRDWSVYIIDQPRRGRAGYTSAPLVKTAIPTTTSEAGVWRAFRNGPWQPPKAAGFYDKTQFPVSGYAIDQFFRQQTPDTGEEPSTAEYRAKMGETVGALFDRIGEGILITHSNSGQYGWETAAARPDLVKAIVAYEPGMCAFPEEEPPEDIPASSELVASRMFPRMMPMEKWKALTKMPIMIVFGDNIVDEPSQVFNEDVWRLARARQFVELVNRHGGDATLVELPKIGIRGNTHAAFADANNVEIADLLSKFLAEKGLDGYERPHTGPKPVEMPVNIPFER
ncbi:alpha/beta fold hydrolase [Sutterella sp.]|uniref:alpha/beta hydrolase n=1 Tax=Sutterella sp. TaxID=1981025 RepID=UPI0026DFDEE0|nr:alpha/beta fold hydrolase [Sutterella sp.]MDO5532858.1 alpha/beta fold hydrolase [Sutterella sp.]